MRRGLAITLLLVFGLPLIAPGFTAGPEDASLPACCRRNGRHHCMMRGMWGNSPVTGVGEKCPYAPLTSVALMLPHAFVSHGAMRLTGVPVGPSVVAGEAEAGYRVSVDRTRHKRGPPLRLAL